MRSLANIISRLGSTLISWRCSLSHEKKKAILICWLALLSLVVGCAEQHDFDKIELTPQAFSGKESETPPELLVSEYRLSPGDKMDVLFEFSTWQQKENFTLAVDHKISVKFVHLPELNETQRIQPNGKISLPYIGEIYVVGKTIQELSEELRTAYSIELIDPELYVTVNDFQAGIQELKKDLYTPSGGLSRRVTVRPDGICTFPIIGDIFVVNKTLPELNEMLNEAYIEKISGISVLLFLEKHTETLIYVAGDVKKPGKYPITRPITVMEAVALAEGARQSADLKRAVVVRKINNKIIAKQINITDFSSSTADFHPFYLQPDDFLYLPERRLAKLAAIINELQDILLFRGWATSINVPIFDLILDTSD